MPQRIYISKIKQYLLVAAVTCVCGALAYWNLSGNDSKYQELLNKESVAVWPTNLPVSNLAGELSVPTYKSKVTIFHFWASWCAPCVEEWPEIIESATHNPDIEYFLISTDRQIEPLEKFLANQTLNNGDPTHLPNLHILRDPMRKWFDFFQLNQIPTTFIFDSRKTLAYQWYGQKKWQQSETVALLKSVK